MPQIQSSSTIEKAIQLLLALSDEGCEIGTTDLGKKLGIHKATVSRILMKLAEHEFVYKNKETRKYWLGPTIHQLAMNMADVSFEHVMRFARPHVDELRDSVGETTVLEIWLGNSTVPTYCAQSNNPLKVIPPPGEPLELHAAAGAKAILAFTHTDRVDSLLRGELTKVTEQTITDKALLNKKLSEFNLQGYSVDYEETHEGICAVAAPIFNQLKQPVAALVILVPASRSASLESAELLSQLKYKALLISNEISSNNTRSGNIPTAFWDRENEH